MPVTTRNKKVKHTMKYDMIVSIVMKFFSFLRIVADKLAFKVARFNAYRMRQKEVKRYKASDTKQNETLHKVAVRKTVNIKRY